MTDLRIINADVIEGLGQIEAESVQCVVTSPPYWGLRDYGVAGQIGLEATPEEYVERMVAVFHEVRRVLRADGVAWVNIGDGYYGNTKGSGGPSEKQLSNAGSRFTAGSLPVKPKDLCGIPWRVAFALQADGWYLRSDVIWHKPNPMPESVTDRPTKAHEYVFLLTKQARYFWDANAVAEALVPGTHPPGNRSRYESGRPDGMTLRPNRDTNYLLQTSRNVRTVWTIPTEPYPEAHFATFPTALAERCIRAGSAAGDMVLDPFAGSGTVGQVARALGRSAVLIELNPDYCRLIEKRCALPWERHQRPDTDQQTLFGVAP